MLQITVTGKIESIDLSENPQQDGCSMVFRLRETYWQGEKLTRVWRVCVPNYLSKTAEALVKKDYHIGVTSSKFMLQDDFAAQPPVPVMWLEAEKLFYL